MRLSPFPMVSVTGPLTAVNGTLTVRRARSELTARTAAETIALLLVWKATSLSATTEAKLLPINWISPPASCSAGLRLTMEKGTSGRITELCEASAALRRTQRSGSRSLLKESRTRL
ncbi:hypothetical protein D3C87_1444100 [compost metagenome]